MDTSTSAKNYYHELRSLLDRGFYTDNFEEITKISFEAAGAVDQPLFSSLMWLIFSRLDSTWSDRPFEVATSTRMEQILRPPIYAYLDAAETGATPEEELALLNEISSTYRDWRRIERELIYGRWAELSERNKNRSSDIE